MRFEAHFLKFSSVATVREHFAHAIEAPERAGRGRQITHLASPHQG